MECEYHISNILLTLNFLVKKIFYYYLFYLSEHFKQPAPVDVPSKVKCLILGHSFIARLRRDLTSNSSINMYLNSSFIQIDWCGINGATVDTLNTNEKVKSKLSEFKPHVVVLEIGSNDLCSPDDPKAIGKEIMQYVNNLIKHFNVHQVVVNCVIQRTKKSRWVKDLKQYNKNVNILNQFLEAVCDHKERIHYWKHRSSLIKDLKLSLLDDGVHFNPQGQFVYYKSLRDAVLSGIESYLFKSQQ